MAREGGFPLELGCSEAGLSSNRPGQTWCCSTSQWPASACRCGMLFRWCVPLDIHLFVSLLARISGAFIGTGWGRDRPGWSWEMQQLGMKTDMLVLT